MKIGWDGIDEFVAVAAAGTFVGGARLLGVSTTHMSRAIVLLESRVQAQLLHRTTRSVKLTDTGRVFLSHCERMVHERDEAIAQINERGEPQGELRVTCSIAMGERFVAPIVRAFAKCNPRLDVTIDLTNRLIDLVAEGFDLGVRTGEVVDPRLIGVRIASRTLYTCAAPQYLAEKSRPKTVEALNEHQCLLGSAATWHFQTNGQHIAYRPAGRFRCNSGTAIVDAAIAGMGICQLPEFYVLPHLKEHRLEVILDQFRPAEEPIWAVYPQRRHLLPKISGLVELLQAELPGAMGMG